jgi:tRNA-2-methylthio-N6-dimethylallyladenosine synthase
MNRSYTIEDYLRLVDTIRTFIPGIALSTDIIAGFPGETDDDHQQTISVLNRVNFDGAFMFKYSARENTKAWEMGDTVPDEVKTSRLNEIIELQQTISLQRNRPLIGQIVDVLVERESTKSSSDWMGRTDTNKTVIFPKEHIAVGQTVRVKIDKCNSATLFGSPCDVTSESKPYRIAVNQ